jgi:hypothetical protein
MRLASDVRLTCTDRPEHGRTDGRTTCRSIAHGARLLRRPSVWRNEVGMVGQ